MGRCLFLLPSPAALQEEAVKQRWFSRSLHVLGGVVGLRCHPRHMRSSLGGEDNPAEKVPLQPLHLAVGSARVPGSWCLQPVPRAQLARVHEPSCRRLVPSAAGAFSCIKPTPNDSGKLLLLADGWGKENINLLCKAESGASPSRAKIGRLLRDGVLQTAVWLVPAWHGDCRRGRRLVQLFKKEGEAKKKKAWRKGKVQSLGSLAAIPP